MELHDTVYNLHEKNLAVVRLLNPSVVGICLRKSSERDSTRFRLDIVCFHASLEPDSYSLFKVQCTVG